MPARGFPRTDTNMYDMSYVTASYTTPDPAVGPAQPATGTGPTIDQLVHHNEALTRRLEALDAEYAQHRRRTAKELQGARTAGAALLVKDLLVVLDGIDRAEAAGDLHGGFAHVATQMRKALAEQGLQRYGRVGAKFDPRIHHAIAEVPAPTLPEKTVIEVVASGYALGDIELRPAQVIVGSPT